MVINEDKSKDLLTDYHVHTYHSDDSECPMEDMVKQAIALDLHEICFTDHIDYGVKTDNGPKDRRNCNCKLFFEELNRLREQYKDKITIKAGMEFGIQRETIPIYQELFHAWPFDFIILSNHQVDNKEFWNYQFQKGLTQDEIHEAYYRAIYDVISQYKDYSVLGHLDMIKRYDPYGEYPDEIIMPIVEKILRQVIEDGKGIEVNTSSFRYGLPDLTPSKAILKLYYELGGRILTIGSDAHKTSQLGDHIKEVKEILREIGFEEICTFDGMKHQFHKI